MRRMMCVRTFCACSKAFFRSVVLNCYHYENMPIQIYRKFHLQKLKKKKPELNSDIFHISAQNIDCGYSLEPPRQNIDCGTCYNRI